MAKVKLISDTLKALLLAFLHGLDKFLVQRIPVEDVRIGISMLLAPVKKMVYALNDDEPKNDEQVRELWRKFANQDLSDYSETTLSKLISGIKDENIRPALTALVQPTVGMLRIVTDEIPENEAQLKELWEGFLKNPQTHDVVLNHLLAPMLYGFVNNKDLVEYILGVIADILDGEGKTEQANELRIHSANFLATAA